MSSSSTSLQISTSSPPFCPFSRLPFELIEAIIEAAVPTHFEEPTYKARQATLLSLCLVSRLFHQIAKPRLFAVAYLVGPDTFEIWKSLQEEEKGSLCRELVLESIFENDLITVSKLRPVLGSQPNLTYLLLESIVEGNLDLVLLADMKQLSFLLLSNVQVTATHPFILPALSTISILCSKFDQSSFSHIVSASFPALRAFAWHEVYGGQVAPIKKLLKRLIPQLECLSLVGHLANNFGPNSLARIQQKTLFDFRLTRQGAYPAERIRIIDVPSNSETALVDLDIMQAQLLGSHRPNPPSLLYLSLEYTILAYSNLDLQVGLEDFLRECNKRNVEVIFEELTGKWNEDPGFSADFSRRMKERKKKELAELESGK